MGENLENRISVLEDIEAIKQLKSMYCYLADAGIAGDEKKMDDLVARFTEDAWVDFSEFGVHKGKKAIEVFYKEVVTQTLSYSAHMVANPVIEVDGNNASGNWYVFVPCTLRSTGKAAWLQAKYEEVYRKIDGKWYWKSMIARFDYISPFEEGWAKTRMVSL